MRICLADEEVLASQSLAAALTSSANPAIRIINCSGQLSPALMEMRRSLPDLLIISGPLFTADPRALSLELALELRRTRLAVFADRLSDLQLEQALAHEHVCGLLSKRAPLPEFISSCRELASTGFHVSPGIRDRLRWPQGQPRPRVKPPGKSTALTGRQLEVLIQFASGEGIREIAARLQLSEKAVESHKYRIMHRLGINNRVQLCRWAIREGLIQP